MFNKQLLHKLESKIGLSTNHSWDIENEFQMIENELN